MTGTRPCVLQAINVMSHLDFQITQIVDSNVGIQARIPKYVLGYLHAGICVTLTQSAY